LNPEDWGIVAMWLARLAGSLPVLRWPLAGALLAIGVDLFDLVLMNTLPLPRPFDYQSFDKAADLMYMATFGVVALRWKPLERNVAVGLLALRLAGVGLFELEGWRLALFAFPNLFEFWFLLVAARDRFVPGYRFTNPAAVRWLVALLASKLAQEYLLHVDRRLDRYSLPQAIDWVRRLLMP
jgi:hypothetical protein